MKRRFLIVFSLIVLLAAGSLANADGRRSFYSTCYQPYYQTYYPSYSYSYPSYPTYTAPATPAVPAYSKDWRTALVEYNTALKEIEAYNQALGKVVPGYADVAYPGQAATLYAYPAAVAVTSVKERAYGGFDVNQWQQTAGRLAQQAREGANLSNSEINASIATAVEGELRVSESVAKGQAAERVMQAAERVLRAAEASSSASKTTTTTVIQPNAVANVSDPSMQAFLRDVAGPACASCHTGPKAKGNVDITQYGSFTPAQKAVVLDRITTADLSKRMPRLADGKPGSLSPEGIRAFATH